MGSASHLGGDERRDLRLVKVLGTLDKYGFTLANAQGSDPPSPGLLETITLEHGVRYDQAGWAERLEPWNGWKRRRSSATW